MNELQELLQKTLQKAASNFDKAVNDLTESANAISHAVINQTNARARIVLERVKQGEGSRNWVTYSKSTYFRLSLKFDHLTQNLLFFEVPPSGYPINAAGDLSMMQGGLFQYSLQDKQTITNLFKEMVSDPESELVLRLLQLMREPAEKPTAKEDDSDNIPR